MWSQFHLKDTHVCVTCMCVYLYTCVSVYLSTDTGGKKLERYTKIQRLDDRITMVSPLSFSLVCFLNLLQQIGIIFSHKSFLDSVLVLGGKIPMVEMYSQSVGQGALVGPEAIFSVGKGSEWLLFPWGWLSLHSSYCLWPLACALEGEPVVLSFPWKYWSLWWNTGKPLWRCQSRHLAFAITHDAKTPWSKKHIVQPEITSVPWNGCCIQLVQRGWESSRGKKSFIILLS